jgi:hypothetical protein
MIPCLPGQFCPEDGVVAMCPAGYYCPTPAEKLKCKKGYFCPKGSTEGIKCRSVAGGSCFEGTDFSILVCTSTFNAEYYSHIVSRITPIKDNNNNIS